MPKLPTLERADQDFPDMTEREKDIEAFEKETGIPVPEFIRNLPRILPSEAANLVVTHEIGMVYDDEYAYLNAKNGLSFCRAYGVSVQEAMPDFESIVKIKTPVELFDQINNRTPEEVLATIEEEKERRAQHNEDIAHTEIALIKKELGLEIEAQNMDELIAWLKETFQLDIDDRSMRMGIVEHYLDLTREAAGSFDPAYEWMEHHRGNLNLGDQWYCGYDNGVSFATRIQERGKPSSYTTTEDWHPEKLLVTHSSQLGMLTKIDRQEELGGLNAQRVCLSAGRAVGTRLTTFLLIFPRQAIEQLYDTYPVAELNCAHENEIRTREAINPKLAIGFVPLTEDVFPDVQHGIKGSTARGEQVLDRWQERYQREGRLFSDEEQTELREITKAQWEKIQAENPRIGEPEFILF